MVLLRNHVLLLLDLVLGLLLLLLLRLLLGVSAHLLHALGRRVLTILIMLHWSEAELGLSDEGHFAQERRNLLLLLRLTLRIVELLLLGLLHLLLLELLLRLLARGYLSLLILSHFRIDLVLVGELLATCT